VGESQSRQQFRAVHVFHGGRIVVGDFILNVELLQDVVDIEFVFQVDVVVVSERVPVKHILFLESRLVLSHAIVLKQRIKAEFIVFVPDLVECFVADFVVFEAIVL